MIVLKTDWTKENLKKYILFTSFFGNKMTRALLIGFFLCFVMILGTCIAMFFMLDMPLFLILAGVIVLFCAATVLYFSYTIKKNIQSALSGNQGDSETDGLMITEEKILVCKNGEPVGEIGWDKITSINFNDKDGAAYLLSDGGAVLILEYKNITAGTEKELKELLQIKNVKLPKEA